MTQQDAIDKLTALAAISGSATWERRRAVYLSPGDAEALRLAVEALRDRQNAGMDHHEQAKGDSRNLHSPLSKMYANFPLNENFP